MIANLKNNKHIDKYRWDLNNKHSANELVLVIHILKDVLWKNWDLNTRLLYEVFI